MQIRDRFADTAHRCATSNRKARRLGIVVAILLVTGCGPNKPPTDPTRDPTIDTSIDPEVTSAASKTAAAESNLAPKRALFGDLHVHSRWSFDAFSLGVQTTPEDTYRFARGEPIEHVSGSQIALTGPPLDFLAVTEHAEYMGVTATLDDPESPFLDVPIIKDLLSEDRQVAASAISRFARSLQGENIVQALNQPQIARPTWQRLINLANEHNEPGVFTTLVGYEYTSMPAGQNLHRNVFIRGPKFPDLPFTSFDSPNPEALWAWMDKQRTAGVDLLSVPHNGNASNGLMYPLTNYDGSAMSPELAAARIRNEPLSEVFQIKGQSETHPDLSPDDPFAGFEQFDRVLGRMQEKSKPAGSFIRDALKQGLVLEQTLGVNPYEMGVIGSSDGHNSSSPVDEADYSGKIGVADGTPTARLLEGMGTLDAQIVSRWGAAGLVGIWAHENTRDELFDALQRRETFATSGPRISLRLFGSWDFSETDLDNMAQVGYQRGVSMGQQLQADAAATAAAPSFLLAAMQDPNGANLERLQIIKGWVDDGVAHEMLVDVACAQANASGGCAAISPTNDCTILPDTGASALRAHWQDTHYDSSQPTFYYARVIEVPTCRWSTYDATELDIPLPDHLPRTLQERAVSSPIWVKPAGQSTADDR